MLELFLHERHNRQAWQDVRLCGKGSRISRSMRLKRHSTVGRVARFPSHREVAARQGIAGSCLFVLLSGKASHIRRCFLHTLVDRAGYASRLESSQKIIECELSPTNEVVRLSPDSSPTGDDAGDVQIIQGLLANRVSGGFAKIPFLFQGVPDAFFTG
jgi:hypothetical protein